tara:strand:- start:163 stop:606 length:444 start_codon:yes stop_codon:yes gene_type:complete
MKGKIIILGISLLMLNSCVSKSDYEKSELEKSELEIQLQEIKQELSDVKYKYNQIKQEKSQAEIERNKKPFITENKALQLIGDNFSFYERNMVYRNVKLRRIADNSFKVSLETCINKKNYVSDDFFWKSKVRTLTVYNNGKYDFPPF